MSAQFNLFTNRGSKLVTVFAHVHGDDLATLDIVHETTGITVFAVTIDELFDLGCDIVNAAATAKAEFKAGSNA